VAAEGYFVREMPHCLAIRLQEPEALAIGRPIHHTGVGVTSSELVPSAVQALIAPSFQLVFPSHELGFGKEGAQGTDNFGSGPQREGEAIGVASDFAWPGILHQKIAEGGHMEDSIEFPGVILEEIFQRRIGSEGMGRHPRSRVSRALAAVAHDIKSDISHGVGEDGPQLAAGLIGEAAHVIDGFVGGAAGNKNVR